MKKKIVHIGVGAFFRAHQAWYTQAVDDAQDWEVIAFTGRSDQAAKQLMEQGCKYTLIERGPEIDQFREIRVITRAASGTDLRDLVETISSPEVAIITLTITESGYTADVSQPLQSSALGRLALALDARRQSGATPVAVVPCDNLQKNGETLRICLMTLGNQLGAEFIDYLSSKVSFVSSSVDRITPRTTQADIELVRQSGFADSMPVVTEPFTDWILSGEFPISRPNWELAGARFVDDIEPYERRKLWFLNGAHSILALVGLAKGHATVFEAIHDSECRRLVEAWWSDAENILDGKELELEKYKQKLMTRFENPRIEHLLSQIAVDSSLKLRVRFTDVIEQLRSLERTSLAAAETFAYWIELCQGQDSVLDANSESIAFAKLSSSPITGLVKIVSPKLATNTEFVEAVTSAWQKIQVSNSARNKTSTALVE